MGSIRKVANNCPTLIHERGIGLHVDYADDLEAAAREALTQRGKQTSDRVTFLLGKWQLPRKHP